MDLDKIDLKILNVIQSEGRIRTVELAERVGLSPTPCARRLKQLEEGSVITGYRAMVDQAKLGFPITVFVSVELERKSAEDLQTFERTVRQFEEVVQGFIMTGSQDFMLRVVAEDLLSFEQFLQEKLARVPGIRTTRSRFALRSIIPDGRLPVKI